LNPSRRFRVEKGNRIIPTNPDGLGQSFKGRALQQFKEDIQKVTERPPIPGKISGQLILPKLQMKPGMKPGNWQDRPPLPPMALSKAAVTNELNHSTHS